MLAVKVTGVKELQAKLAKLDGEFQRAVTMALAAGAQVVKNAAQREAPYLTGNLQRSIHVVPVEPGKPVSFAPLNVAGGIENTTGATITVSLKEGQSAAVVGTDVVYAPPHEFLYGHPYLRPALDENHKVVEDEIARALKQIIDAAGRA